MYKLSNQQIDIVEAVYLVLIDDQSSYDFKYELSRYIYTTNIFMYVYLDWLLTRWHFIYSKHKNHLPKRIKY